MNLLLGGIEDAAEICRICSSYPELTIDCRFERYVVDAKSILGLQMLCHHNVKLVCVNNEDPAYKDFVRDISNYINHRKL